MKEDQSSDYRFYCSLNIHRLQLNFVDVFVFDIYFIAQTFSVMKQRLFVSKEVGLAVTKWGYAVVYGK